MDVSESVETINETASWLSSTLQSIGSGAFEFILKAAFAVLLYFIIRKILFRFLNWMDGRMEKRNVEASMRSFAVSLIKYSVLGFTVIQMIVALDIVEASSIAALLASAGVGISLAVQGTLSNFAGGILLLVLRPFKTGDYIQVPDLNAEGTVEKIEMYYTTITTVYHEAVMIPNSSLTNNQVKNLTALGSRVLPVKVGISYHADIRRAKEIMEEIARSDVRITGEGLQIFVSELGESSVELEMRVGVAAADYWPLKTEIYEKIKKAFDAEGIQIPYQQMDLHIIEEKS